MEEVRRGQLHSGVVEDETCCGAHEPGEAGLVRRAPDDEADRDDRREHHGDDRNRVPAAAIVVGALRAHGEQVVDDDLLLLHEVEVSDENAEQRSDHGSEGVHCVVDRARVVEQIPRRDDDRPDRCDHAAHAPGDLGGRDIREVECWGDEVGDDVDADRGDRERQHAEDSSGGVVDLVDDVHGVGDDLAVSIAADHGDACRDGAHDEDREEEEVDREAPEVALLDLAEGLAVAREIAEVEHRTREVGDHEGEGADHHGDGRPRSADAGALRQVEVHIAPPGLGDQVCRKRDHDDVDGGSAEVDELADGVHAVPEDERLQHPHQDETGPAEQ